MTPEEIRALPKRVRDYIFALEARCDPADELQELICRREQVVALQARIADLEEAHKLAGTGALQEEYAARLQQVRDLDGQLKKVFASLNRIAAEFLIEADSAEAIADAVVEAIRTRIGGLK